MTKEVREGKKAFLEKHKLNFHQSEAALNFLIIYEDFICIDFLI